MAKDAQANQSTTKLTPKAVLTKLRTAYRSMKQNMDAARGNYGQMVANAEEEKHLHKRAWAQAMREDKMEPEALATFYEHLDHYREELGLNDRAESAPSLPTEGDEDAERGNVTEMPSRSPATAH